MGATTLILAALAASPPPVDASTMRHKVLCGYQGWFRCPGDPSGDGWRHWSRNAKALTVETLTFEMWPDTAEFGDDELYVAPGFTHPDGTAARLFSSTHEKTVDRHFRWMEQYGIDGVFVQRFLVETAKRRPTWSSVTSDPRRRKRAGCTPSATT